MDCELLPTCLFFNDKMAEMPVSVEVLKRRYCQHENKSCARYMIFKALGRAHVPSNLFPTNIERAKAILEQAR